MNTEDQELLEIEKMLETMKDIEPAPELRGETLSKARKSWQSTSNFSYTNILTWAAVALITFSLGYFIGQSKDRLIDETSSPTKDKMGEEIKKIKKDEDKIMKSGR